MSDSLPMAEGERVGADEFLRRCWNHGPATVELVDGVVRLPGPRGKATTGRARASLKFLLIEYEIRSKGIDAARRPLTFLNARHILEPTYVLRLPAGDGGGSTLVDGDYLAGPPELAAEVVEDDPADYLNQKCARLRPRRRARVRRLADPRRLKTYWSVLNDAGGYDSLPPDPADGLFKSRVFPGLWLDADALVRGDLAGVRAAVERGCDTPGHADFARQLARGRA